MATGLITVGIMALLFTGAVVGGVKFLTWIATPKRR